MENGVGRRDRCERGQSLRSWRGLLASGPGATILTVLLACGCGQSNPAASTPSALTASAQRARASAGEGADWRLWFTGDARGYLKPCGCTEGLFGGVARRGTKLGQVLNEGDLLVDLGNLVVGKRPHQRLKLQYMIESLEALEYDVLVPGTGELLIGERFEQMVSQVTSLKIVCANLLHKTSGELVFSPMAVLPAGEQSRVALIGLTSPTPNLGARYDVLPFDEVLPAAIEKASLVADHVVVAGFIKGESALQIADSYPSVALVAGAWVPSGSSAPLRRDGAPVMLGGDRGQYLFWARFGPTRGTVDGGQIWLADDVPDNSMMSALVARHDDQASLLGPSHKERVQSFFRAAGRTSSESCAECHRSEYESWRRSKHAHAMQTLAAKRSENDPNCLGCHYQDVSRLGVETVVGVGCSACHEGTEAHVRAMRSGGTGSPPRLEARARIAACERCHDEANSPSFDAEDYWLQIAHGRDRNTRGSE